MSSAVDSCWKQKYECEANGPMRLAHSLPPQLKLCSLYPTFGNHRIYQLQHAETKTEAEIRSTSSFRSKAKLSQVFSSVQKLP